MAFDVVDKDEAEDGDETGGGVFVRTELTVTTAPVVNEGFLKTNLRSMFFFVLFTLIVTNGIYFITK
jgi:hypothetical protein